jgi:hypothetical protein
MKFGIDFMFPYVSREIGQYRESFLNYMRTNYNLQ